MAKKPLFLTKLKRRLAPYFPFLPKIALVALGLLLLFVFIRSLPRLLSSLKPLSLARRTALSFFQNPETVLRTTGRRTNILILGKGGAGHEAPDLTDTIIFLSYHHPSGTTIMLSLPRDIWVDSLRAKLNTAYYYGNLKQSGGGLILVTAAVEEIIDQPVHYGLAIDFAGFTKAIDLLGGVDIDVLHSFDDYKYPIPGKEDAQPESDRYEHLHFDAGPQTLSGDRALKYVRSRNAEGNEGTDFARAARQQQILLALQKKALSTQVLLNPSKLTALLSVIATSIDTDISNGDYTAFAKLLLKFDRSKLQTYTLDQGDDESGQPGLLVNPPPLKYQGQWVLTGRDGSWQEVQDYVANILKE